MAQARNNILIYERICNGKEGRVIGNLTGVARTRILQLWRVDHWAAPIFKDVKDGKIIKHKNPGSKGCDGEIAMAIKETGLICTGESVRAILDGRKTQTRRVIKPQPYKDDFGKPTLQGGLWVFPSEIRHPMRTSCPYGKVSDKLWVRETFAYYPDGEHVIFKEREGKDLKKLNIDLKGCWKSSRYMPKRFARIWLEITGIRVEQVQDINEEDAIAEGLETKGCCLCKEFDGVRYCIHCNQRLWDFIGEFRVLWDSINAKRGYGWDENNYVWVVEFRKVK